MIYTKSLGKYSYGDLFTVDQYLDCVDNGSFIDDDGFGHPVKNNKVAVIDIYPSDWDSKIPEDATHILWFNK